MAEAKKRKGTALLAVMNESCSSCAGSPICEAHCPVDDCINLLYEELPGGGLKPYRVFVDNDKCIGCQMCYSDDLTKIQQHKETGEIFYEYANRFYDSNRKPIPPDAVPKRIQLQLIGTESEDRLDKKICTGYLWPGQYPVRKKDREGVREKTQPLFTLLSCRCRLPRWTPGSNVNLNRC